jgi:ubiquinone/menaquinone biosynthesis C-methylase UbiE
MGDQEYRPFRDVAQRNFTQSVLEVPLMVRLLRLSRERRTLEIGCGRRNALPALARTLRPRLLVGIDVDRGFLVQASKCGAVSAVDLVQADVRSMPFRDGAIDLVIDFGTCYHIRRAERALAEVERVLSSGGTFAYETPANQLLSHPIRSFGRSLPWAAAHVLRPLRKRLLWSSRVKVRRAM